MNLIRRCTTKIEAAAALAKLYLVQLRCDLSEDSWMYPSAIRAIVLLLLLTGLAVAAAIAGDQIIWRTLSILIMASVCGMVLAR